LENKMLSFEQVLDELEKKSDFSREDLKQKIEKKHEELSGLVSLEGAGHLIARDLGINLLVLQKRSLKIEKITDGMKSIDIKARIQNITDVREFNRKDGSKGRVVNLILTDGTKDARLPLWDKQVDLIEETIKEGDVVDIRNAYSKKDPFGRMEIRLSKYSNLQKTEDDESIPKQTERKIPMNRVSIKNAEEGFYEIRGNIVQIFNTNLFYNLCPTCRKKVELKDEKYVCEEHGKVKPEAVMRLSGIIDDGTSNLRIVLFRDQAKNFSGLDASVLMDLGQEEAIKMVGESVLGNDMILRGRVKKNELLDNMEMIVNDFSQVNIQEESKMLIDEIKSLEK